MNAELLFIYDTHCPWSYAATKLLNEIEQKLPNITIHFWHSAFFSAVEYVDDNYVTAQQIAAVEQASECKFSTAYKQQLEQAKDSTLAANVMAWCNHKVNNKALALLNAIQQAHFQQGLALTSKEQIEPILARLKLSPPAKVLTPKKLTKDADVDLHEIIAMQDIINTQAIPALLLAHNDNLVLLNHNLYLEKPAAIIEAIELELQKH